jgi:hypothetical protein
LGKVEQEKSRTERTGRFRVKVEQGKSKTRQTRKFRER